MLPKLPQEDSYLHKGWRNGLVQQLREKGIKDEKVLAAIGKIPRHFFLDTAFERRAYEDAAFPIAANQTISQPYTVAFQSQLLDIQKYDKVLEIGTGSGYQAMVLAEMGAKVHTIERQRELYNNMGDFFYLKNYPSLKRHYGDGFKGLPSYAPFHKIIITAGAPYLPPLLIDQLKVGGYMVLPIDKDDTQQMLRITKNEDGSLSEEQFGIFDFVPMLEGKNG